MQSPGCCFSKAPLLALQPLSSPSSSAVEFSPADLYVQQLSDSLSQVLPPCRVELAQDVVEQPVIYPSFRYLF